ncbi:MAG TPA: N-methyl-L-tryptophan oxidase [Nitrososphaerales archaeon]|nr:N-methyl-L-tryptophan oxidase [Nitrososphaerales archaeon]
MTLSQEVGPPAPFTGRSRWDAIVVGCGVMGASVTYNLASKGLKVLNVEKFGVNHENGSSHGKTRIIRLAYYEDPRYVPLLRRAFDLWRELESKAGKRLLLMTGGLMIGHEDGALVRGALKSARAHSLPHEVLSGSEAGERFEAFSLTDEFSAVYEQNAGVLFAEDSVRAFVGLGSEAGAEFRFSEEVSGWKSRAESVEVETPLGRQTASRLIFCAGAWTNGLLGGSLPLQCERQVPLWFSSRGEDRFTATKMPIFMMEEGAGSYYYGIPEVGHGVKVARTHGGEVGDPDKVRREVTERDVAPVSDFISRRLRGLDSQPMASTTCLYTNTPDLNFVVGQLPGEKRVTVVSACSGHGFKFASVMGEVAADVATGEKVEFDISFLSPERFKAKTN